MKKIILTITLFFLLDFTFGQDKKPSKNNIHIKSYGQKILDGKVKPTEDKQTFQIMDSLLAIYSQDADFYFNVFNKILQTSDGALSEHVSTLASKYYLDFTNRFLPRTKKLDTTNLNTWFYMIAYDLHMKNNDGEKGLPKIKTNLKNKTCSNFVIVGRDLDFLFECNDKIYARLEKMEKEN